ncbi:MAG: isopenicillin N synthase family dioxygenase [Blastocatellia bacterium]
MRDTKLKIEAAASNSLQAKRIPFDFIPVIDLEPWFVGDVRAKRQVAQTVHTTCRNIGFMYVRNHGISQQLVDETFQQAQCFFSLPDEEKRQVHYEKSGRHRGYIPMRGESSDPSAKGDLKEAFDYGLELPCDDLHSPAAQRMRAPNLFPTGVPGFREAVESCLAAMTDLAKTLFQIFAAGFGLPAQFFDDKIDKPIAQMRLLHYPAQRPTQDSPASTDYLGIGAHSDYECFTILAQDETGGLQVQNPAGEWIAAPPVEGTFVINIGEMMTRWTNDTFASTPHRVINASGQERYSIPFFFATNYDTIISCLESCQGPDRPARYPPIAAGDYLAQRLKEIYGV